MIVDDDLLEQWSDVVCSPLGAVEKKDIDPAIEVRLIHDLSFPDLVSTNASFDKSSAPDIRYHYIVAIADRIEDLVARYPHCVIRVLTGDVKGAYRHLMVASQHVHWMAARIPEANAVLIDLSAPFGWSGSPPFYGAFGRAITWLVQQNSPSTVSPSEDNEPFWGFEWVDDHLLIEVDVSDRLQLAEATLRHAMLAILGPRAINEEKFSHWETRLNALGLTWDTINRTVSIPGNKIKKALERLSSHGPAVYQRLQSACNRAPRHGVVKLAAGAKADLVWFEHILAVGHLQELALSIFGTRDPKAHVHLYMNASNLGLAVLNPSINEFIQIRFDSEEIEWIHSEPKSNKSSINVREHLCIALALWTWGPTWTSADPNRTMIVQCWSDNRAAVAWSNSLASDNDLGQEVNRAIGLAEAIFNVRVRASHLPGSSNFAADAASRAWVLPFSDIWANFSSSWRQVPVPKTLRKLYLTFSKTFSPSHWPSRPALSTQQLGSIGKCGVKCSDSPFGCRRSRSYTPTNSHSLECCWKFGWNAGSRGNAASTVVAKISHIAWHHRHVLGYPVGLSDGHKLAINGMRRQEADTTRKAPVTVALLQIMHKSLDFSQPLNRVIWGAAVLGFFFLLRRSEYLAVGRKSYEFILTRADIAFLDTFVKTAEVAVRFRGGKNDQYKEGTTRSIGRSGSDWLCPIHATWFLVQHHRELQLPDTDPLCTITPGSIVQFRDIAQLIKTAAASSRQQPQRFGTHSLRSGGASALFAAGVDSVAVKQFGRWRSDAFERYVRLNSLQTSTMASSMLNPTSAAANYNGQPL